MDMLRQEKDVEQWAHLERVRDYASFRMRNLRLYEREPETFSPKSNHMTTARGVDELAAIHGFDTDEFIASMIGKRVLDVGGGWSRLNTQLKKIGIPATVITIDLHNAFFSDYANEMWEGNKTGAEINANGHCLPIKDGSVDKILATYSLPMWAHSSDHIESFFNETLRVLKVGGDASITPMVACGPTGDNDGLTAVMRVTSMLSSINHMDDYEVSFGQGAYGETALISRVA